MRSVAFSEWLRPWSHAGVTCFLSEYPVDVTQLAPEFMPQTRLRAHPSHAGQSRALSSGAAPSSGAALTNAQKKGEGSGLSVSPASLPVAEWPLTFQKYFSRVVPSPVLWCYEELGQDLFGEPNQERSACLKNLIGKLQFPKGTSVFWPPSVPAVQETSLCQRVLLQVLQELFPKLVIILGTGQTLALFHGDTQPLPFTQCLFKGHMIVFLPDFSQLMENTSLFNQSVRYLRAIVAQLSIV